MNPTDTQGPIAQVLCRKDINLDHFDAFDFHPSDTAITADPYASASFFHLIINAVLECLLGITGCQFNKPLHKETGILGDIDAYIGTVEAQGQGSLHLHIVLWLQGSVPTQKMKQCLSTEQFCNIIKSFISANIWADLSDAPGTVVISIPRQTTVAFS